MLNWDEVMAFLYEKGYEGKRTEFSVLLDILTLLGSPQEHLKFVHVAGTNGKGSASRMMQVILTDAGYRTGLFISPHLEYMNERFSIDDEMISDEDLQNCALSVKEAVSEYNHRHNANVRPVSFALLTLMAFVYFKKQNCDIVVLEVGIGGRLDSTNVIPCADLSLIMNIGLEHTELLGNTIEEIAWEKGGIIKDGGDVVLYHQSPEAETVIRSLCMAHAARLTITDPSLLCIKSFGPNGIHKEYTYKSHLWSDFHLAGLYQRNNVLAVLDGVDVLRRKGYRIPQTAIQSALARVTWPGRFEILQMDPLVIVDGAHNPNGIEALVQTIKDPKGLLWNKRFLFVVGIMADKDIPSMLSLLSPLAAGFVMETAPDERAKKADALCQQVRLYFDGPVFSESSIQTALDRALSLTPAFYDGIVICGSLYQVAAIRKRFL